MLNSVLHFLKNKTLGWFEPKATPPTEQCPCCDYISLPYRGYDLICPICFWEDNGQDVDALDQRSGPNHGISLRQGRATFKTHGACELEMLKHVLPAEERQKFAYRPREL